jgi:hypothetical protein
MSIDVFNNHSNSKNKELLVVKECVDVICKSLLTLILNSKYNDVLYFTFLAISKYITLESYASILLNNVEVVNKIVEIACFKDSYDVIAMKRIALELKTWFTKSSPSVFPP